MEPAETTTSTEVAAETVAASETSTEATGTAETAATTETAETTETAAPATTDVYTLLQSHFKDDLDNPELDKLPITEESLANKDPETRALLRAILRRSNETEAKRAAEATKREEALTAREKAAREKERQNNRQREAFLALAAKSVKAPGEAPKNADPMTAEGQAALIAHRVAEENAKAWAPVLAERNQLAQQEAWDALLDKHPKLRDPKVSAAFDEFFTNELNAGRDLEKQGSVVPAELAAELYFNRQRATELQAAADKQAQTRAAERARSAGAIGRSAGTPAGDPLAVVDKMFQQGDKAGAYAYLASNPTARAAFNERAARLI